MRVKLADLPSKNTHQKQINRLDRWCVKDNIVASTEDHDKNQYAGGPQDHLLLVNTISPLLVRDSHAEPAGIWSTNSYLKYELVQGYRISNIVPYACCAWAGGTAEFLRIIDRIYWSCAFFLAYHVCFGILEPNLLGLSFFTLTLIVVGLGNLHTVPIPRGLDCSFDRGN